MLSSFDSSCTSPLPFRSVASASDGEEGFMKLVKAVMIVARTREKSGYSLANNH